MLEHSGNSYSDIGGKIRWMEAYSIMSYLIHNPTDPPDILARKLNKNFGELGIERLKAQEGSNSTTIVDNSTAIVNMNNRVINLESEVAAIQADMDELQTRLLKRTITGPTDQSVSIPFSRVYGVFCNTHGWAVTMTSGAGNTTLVQFIQIETQATTPTATLIYTA